MAHGYLSYSPVTGEGPLGPWLYDKLGKLIKKEGKKQSKKLLDGVKDLLKKDKDTTYRNNIGKRFDVTGKKGGENTAKGGGIFGASKEPKGLLAASKGGLVKREDRESALGKNPINSDKKEKNILGPAGSTGRARKGGGPVDMGGSVSTRLNASSFLNKSGQIDGALFEKSAAAGARFNYGDAAGTGGTLGQQIRNAKAAARGDLGGDLKGDSGADIVAAMAKNTQAIITLVDTTEKQTQSGINIADKQAQAQDTILGRAKAKKEETSLEKGEDLSGFMTPEKIMKAIKPPKSKDGGDDKKDGKGGGLPGMPLGGGKGLGKAAKMLGPVAKWTAIIGTGILAGMSLGTHLWHQNNDRKKANAPKSDRLGNLLDDDGNVLSGPSAPTQEEQFVDNDTGERYDPPLLPVEPAKDPNNNPGYNQGGLVSGGKANLVDDVPINADEGEVVMSNRAGNMFGRDTLMSMNTIAGSTNTPSSGGGYAEGGVVGMSPKLRKMYKLLGEGIIEAQMDNKKEVAELQGLGLKNYFEDKNGFEKMGEGLNNFFSDAKNAVGGALSKLFGGIAGLFTSPASAATIPPSLNSGGGFQTDGSAEGNKRAIFAAIKSGGFNDKSASNMLAQIEGESGFQMVAEQSYKNTPASDIRRIMGGLPEYTNAQIDELKKDDKTFFDAMYGNYMGNEGEGYKYRGRGFIQLTGKNNYKAVGDLIGEDLVGNPELMNDPAIAAKATMGYYKMVGANNDNMSTMTGAYNAVYAGSPNKTSLDTKDRERVAKRGGRANTFLSQIKSGELTGAPAASQVGELPDPEAAKGGQDSKIVSASHPDTGAGYTVEGLKDEQGRPAVFSRGGASAFARMMKDSKGIVKGSDITSSMRSRAKNSSLPGASPTSNHLTGNAMDIHGASKNWIIANGARYGWKLNDYPGSHGGHFDFNGAGQNDLASTGSNASAAGADHPAAVTPTAASVDAPMTNSFGINLADFKSASANTGTEMMATSAQVASSNRGGGAPVIHQHYHGSGGGQQNGTPTPSNVATGIDFNAAGLGAFNELKFRTLT